MLWLPEPQAQWVTYVSLRFTGSTSTGREWWKMKEYTQTGISGPKPVMSTIRENFSASCSTWLHATTQVTQSELRGPNDNVCSEASERPASTGGGSCARGNNVMTHLLFQMNWAPTHHCTMSNLQRRKQSLHKCWQAALSRARTPPPGYELQRATAAYMT